MRELNTQQEAMAINGGKTYYCPFGCNKSGNFASVYVHCLWNKCFTNNKTLNGIWESAKWCFNTAFEIELCRVLNKAFKKGKHAY